MKTLIITLLATLAASNFIPVPDYNLSQLEGTWNVQSTYDTTGNDWSLMYCLELSFQIINDSTVTITYTFYQSYSNEFVNTSITLYPDNENSAILYQDTTHTLPPLMVLNVSSIPYWINNSTITTIFAVNYTENVDNPMVLILGASRAYDTIYDIRPYLIQNDFPLSYANNFWFINTACNTHFNWIPLKNFNANSLVKSWNLIAVYEPAGSGLVPWYTGGAIYDWKQAYCAKLNIIVGAHYSRQMILSLKSLYQGDFQRTWLIANNPNLNAVIMGFNINENTLLYVQYADLLGNLILTTGTTTSFFLSTSATSLTPTYRGLFEASLAAMGYEFDLNLINPIDNSSC